MMEYPDDNREKNTGPDTGAGGKKHRGAEEGEGTGKKDGIRSEEHTSELQSPS